MNTIGRRKYAKTFPIMYFYLSDIFFAMCMFISVCVCAPVYLHAYENTATR